MILDAEGLFLLDEVSQVHPKHYGPGAGLAAQATGFAALVFQDYLAEIYQIAALVIMILGGIFSATSFYWKYEDRLDEKRKRIQHESKNASDA